MILVRPEARQPISVVRTTAGLKVIRSNQVETRVISGRGSRGPRGFEGPPGQDGQDGAAAIPPILDGGFG